jgi:23S rRNA pseudouridine2605 synthase
MAMYATGLARVLSKLGFCSRSRAQELIHAGRVRVNGRIIRDADYAVEVEKAGIEVDSEPIRLQEKVYVMLNKPRGLVTTTMDEQGRETVYECFKDSWLPWIAPVGRLDKASEGLILFTNDNDWAAKITNPDTHIAKTYHVQVNCLADEDLCARMKEGALWHRELLRATDTRIVRTGERNSWLEIVLDEGKNRHIRRLLEAFGIEVLRLIRIRIGNLELGNLPKGQWRHLKEQERQFEVMGTQSPHRATPRGGDGHLSDEAGS